MVCVIGILKRYNGVYNCFLKKTLLASITKNLQIQQSLITACSLTEAELHG